MKRRSAGSPASKRRSSSSAKPVIDVSGVRSSCETVARNVLFIRDSSESCSTALRSTSRRCAFWIAIAAEPASVARNIGGGRSVVPSTRLPISRPPAVSGTACSPLGPLLAGPSAQQQR